MQVWLFLHQCLPPAIFMTFPNSTPRSPKKKGPPTKLHIAALFLPFHPSVPGSVSAGGAFFRSRSWSRERREFQRGVHSAVGSPDKLNRRPNCGPPASDPLAKCLGLGPVGMCGFHGPWEVEFLARDCVFWTWKKACVNDMIRYFLHNNGFLFWSIHILPHSLF